MSESSVGPGGYGDKATAPGWGRIMAAVVVVLAVLVAAYLVFAVAQTGTEGGVLTRFFPSGIDRERTIPVDQAPVQPGQQLPSGGARGSVGPAGGTGGTVGRTGDFTGGPTGPSTSNPSSPGFGGGTAPIGGR